MKLSRRRALLLGLLACLILLPAAFTPRPAAAHAFLKRTEPAGGSVVSADIGEVRLVFTERVEVKPDRIAVIDRNGRRVDVRNAAAVPGAEATVRVSLPRLANGVYTVRYALLSSDTHPIAGSFRFGVGVSPADLADAAPSASPTDAASARLDGPLLLNALGRWLNLLGLVLLTGPLAFRLFVLDRPFVGRGGKGGAAAPEDVGEHAAPRLPPSHIAARLFEARLVRWTWLAVLLLIVAQVVSLVAVSAGSALGGLGDALTRAALSGTLTTRFGALWLVRLGLLLIPSLILPLLAAEQEVREEEGPEAAPFPWATGGWWAILASGAGLAALTSLGGHPAATPPVALTVLIDWAHLAAAALWIGGLLALALIVPPVLRSLGPAAGHEVLAAAAPRFSTFALAAVATIVVTGLYQTWAQVSGPAALTATLYGRTLLVKLALVLPLVVLAAVNRSVVLPRLARIGGDGDGDAASAARRLRRTVWGEALLGIAVLLAVGLLTAAPPARRVETAAAGGAAAADPGAAVTNEVTLAANAGDLLVTLTVGPAENGPAVLAVAVLDARAEAVDDAVVRLRLFPPDGGAPQEVALAPRSGRYYGLGDLARPGPWRIEADVARPGGPGGTARYALELPTGGARLLLARADRAMNRLSSLRERQTLGDGRTTVTTDYEYAAPDRLRLRNSAGGETIAAGARRFDRPAGGEWSAGLWPDEGGYRWPKYDYARTATEVTILGREDVDGVPCWVVAFFDPENNARFTFWIGEADALVRRQTMLYTGHFMDSRFFDFNAPIAIEPPIP